MCGDTFLLVSFLLPLDRVVISRPAPHVFTSAVRPNCFLLFVRTDQLSVHFVLRYIISQMRLMYFRFSLPPAKVVMSAATRLVASRKLVSWPRKAAARGIANDDHHRDEQCAQTEAVATVPLGNSYCSCSRSFLQPAYAMQSQMTLQS